MPLTNCEQTSFTRCVDHDVLCLCRINEDDIIAVLSNHRDWGLSDDVWYAIGSIDDECDVVERHTLAAAFGVPQDGGGTIAEFIATIRLALGGGCNITHSSVIRALKLSSAQGLRTELDLEKVGRVKTR